MEKKYVDSAGPVNKVQSLGAKAGITTRQPLSTLQREILEIARRQKYVGYADVLFQAYGFVPSASGKLRFNNHRYVSPSLTIPLHQWVNIAPSQDVTTCIFVSQLLG